GGAEGDKGKKMVGGRARREQVDYAVVRGVSVRRSCALLQVSRSALGYQSRLVARDAELSETLRRISARHPRYGHRFAWALLRRGGLMINRKRVRRVWRAVGVQAGREKPREVRTGHERGLGPSRPDPVGGCACWRRRDGTRCGRTTSCTTAAGTARRSSC